MVVYVCRAGKRAGQLSSRRGLVVGYAYYLRTGHEQPVTAEPAILVEDRFQGQGIGSELAQNLYWHALENGVEAFEVFAHPANERIMRLIRRSGLSFESRIAYGTREMRVWLAGVPERT